MQVVRAFMAFNVEFYDMEKY